MFRLVLMTRKRLIKLTRDSYERGKQEGLKRGYRLGEIAGAAEVRNKGCILSVQPGEKQSYFVSPWVYMPSPDREIVDKLLKDMGFV